MTECASTLSWLKFQNCCQISFVNLMKSRIFGKWSKSYCTGSSIFDIHIQLIGFNFLLEMRGDTCINFPSPPTKGLFGGVVVCPLVVLPQRERDVGSSPPRWRRPSTPGAKEITPPRFKILGGAAPKRGGGLRPRAIRPQDIKNPDIWWSKRQPGLYV